MVNAPDLSMTATSRHRTRAAWLAFSLLTGALAQGPAPSAQVPGELAQRQTKNAPVPAARTPAPLTAAEKKAFQALFVKARPATLRIEDCPTNDCGEPDGVGTAFLISADGLALTAYHVVYGARNLVAVTADRKRLSVEVVGFDDQQDVALLRVNVAAAVPFLPLAPARPAVGDAALSIGNGDGAFLQPKTGRVLGLDAASDRADFVDRALKLSVPLVPGDSGGPVLNARGEVVGVVSYISVEGRAQKITSYAVPLTLGDPLVADLKRGVKRPAPVIGVGLDGELSFLSDLPESLFARANKDLELGLGGTPGAFFTSVMPGSPAAQAGLRPLRYDARGKKTSGDVVSAVNGKRVVNFSAFQYAVRAHRPGDTVTLTVLRDGQTLSVKLTLVGRDSIKAEAE